MNYTPNDSLSVKNGLDLTWEDLSVIYAKRSLVTKVLRREAKTKKIIKNQCGHILSGQLVALMGSSGSGKSSLLNALSFRKVNNLHVSGSIKVNGVEMDRRKMHEISSFVQQENVFIGTLTVKEHLMFHAMLRMHRSLTSEEKKAKVNALINELMLMKCQNSLIGIPGKIKGISGGEKKRLSFATEILNDPMLLFCDEPTSSLDSAMAYSVIESLKRITSSGKSVICTIHQPSSHLFQMFDYNYMLYDGNVALCGKKEEILQFLAGLNMHCPPRHNPADFILDTISVKADTIHNDSMRADHIVQRFCISQFYSKMAARVKIASDSHSSRHDYLSRYIEYRHESHSPFVLQVSQIYKRNAINFIRDKGLLAMRLTLTIIFSILIGVIYLQLEMKQELVDALNKDIFMVTICVGMLTALSSVLLYPHEFDTLRKENESRAYSVGSYFVANILFEIPIHSTLTVLFISLNYWITGLNAKAGVFFALIGWQILVTLVGLAYGHFLSSLTSSPLGAIIVLVPSMMYQFVMNEFFLSNAHSPLDWLKYTSWAYYGFNLAMLNQWISIESIPGSALTPRNGYDVLNGLNIREADWYGYLIGLVGLAFFLRFAAFVVTYIRVRFY